MEKEEFFFHSSKKTSGGNTLCVLATKGKNDGFGTMLPIYGWVMYKTIQKKYLRKGTSFGKFSSKKENGELLR